MKIEPIQLMLIIGVVILISLLGVQILLLTTLPDRVVSQLEANYEFK